MNLKPLYLPNEEKAAALQAVQQWMDTELCTSGPAYMSKEHILRRHFDSLIQCDVLQDPNVVTKKKKGDEKFEFVANDEILDDD